jgi:hypothetical protein
MLFLTAFAFNVAVAAPASPDQFQANMIAHSLAYGDALEAIFDTETKEAIEVLYHVKRTPEYDTCTNPGWFTSKEKQVAACKAVARLLETTNAPIKRRGEERSARVQEEYRLFHVYLRELIEPGQKKLGEEVYAATAGSYNDIYARVSADVKRFNDEHYRECWNKKLGESVKCVVDRTLVYLRDVLPKKMLEARYELHGSRPGAFKKLAEGTALTEPFVCSVRRTADPYSSARDLYAGELAIKTYRHDSNALMALGLLREGAICH